MRSGLRVGPTPADSNRQVACVVMTETAQALDIAAGIHCPDGATAAQRLAQGFTFATVSSDLAHLEQAAAAHLRGATA
nr:hypothetical protein [Streptomyces sabulosicollis]